MAKCQNRSEQQCPVSRQVLQAAIPSLYQQQRAAHLRPRAPRAATGADIATPGPVLVADGVVVPAPATAQQLLSEHPDWSYTAALVRQQRLVIDWDLHIERLARNVEVLSQQRPPAYASFQQWRQMQDNPQAVSSALHKLLSPMVAKALSQLTYSGQDAGEQQAMLTVILGDPEATQQQPSTAQQQAPAGLPAGSTQLCSSGGPPLTVLVWAKPFLPPAPTAAKVLVAGDPRPAARAKHCSWVVDRRPLEQLKQQAGADEVVLSDSSGALLEGLVSNFYVVADAASLAACKQPVPAAVAGVGGGHVPGSEGSSAGAQQGQAGAGMQQLEEHNQAGGQGQQGKQQQQQAGAGLHGLVLLTTGPAADALLGVTQQRVLQACEQLGLPVVLQPAHVNTAAAWREAFLTNCAKGVQPVKQAHLPDGSVWEPPQAAAVVPLLQQQLSRLQTDVDMRPWLS